MKQIVKKLAPKIVINIIRAISGDGRFFYPYRRYTNKYKCIFIHIPKVAGTSVLTLFMGNQVRRDHLSYREFQGADSFSFNDYYKFCFIRNPYDRLVSTYEYLKSGGNKKQDKYFESILNEKYKTFDSFVLDFLDNEIIHSHLLFKPQYTYIYDYKDECMVDFVGRFECLESDFRVVSNKLGLKGELKKINSSTRKEYQKYYFSPDVIKKVNMLYKKDFELLGYDYLEVNTND